MFVLSFKNGDNHPTRNSFDKYYMLLLEIKNFNGLTDNKIFFDQPVKDNQETYEKLIEISRNDDYATGDLLDYLYRQKYYKLIVMDLSKQTNMNVLQQINFVGKLEEGEVQTMFFIDEKHQKTILNFSLDLFIDTE